MATRNRFVANHNEDRAKPFPLNRRPGPDHRRAFAWAEFLHRVHGNRAPEVLARSIAEDEDRPEILENWRAIWDAYNHMKVDRSRMTTRSPEQAGEGSPHFKIRLITPLLEDQP